jgi:hypothetical protein
VQRVIPESVGEAPARALTVSDRAIVAALVNSVRELKVENDGLVAD